MRKFLLLLIFTGLAFPVDIGGFFGEGSNSKGITYGVFASLSFFPFTRFEIEGSKLVSSDKKMFSLTGEVGMSFSGVHPYFLIGYGNISDEKGKFHPLRTSYYFPTMGGGVKMKFFSEVLQLRLDFRKISMRENPYYRAYVGFFFSI